MNRFLLVLTVSLLIGVSSYPLSAQIHIGGSLSGVLVDTTYIVDSVIYVMPDSSLIIAPGATFLFDSIYSFIIQGYLYAVGTPTDSIYFMPSPGQDSLGAITFQNMAVDSCVLSYCYITGASASAVNVYQTDMTISHCTFTNNKANWGGGVYVSFAAPTISNCVVTNNAALRNGGGIYCTNSSPKISDCIITSNSCNLLYGTGASGRGGGGITANHNSSPSVNHCLIANNHSLENGGGFAINDNSHATISSCSFENNSADSAGGGIFCSVNSNPVVRNCSIYGNRALQGGGLSLFDNVRMVITTCEITADTATLNGGGIYTLRSLPELADTKIQQNIAGIDGGGVFCSDSSLVLTNCILSKNNIESGLGARGGGIAIVNNSQPFIQRCEISANFITGFEGATSGGGVYCDNSTPIFDRCTFVGNRLFGAATGMGGGFACINAVPLITNSIIGINLPDQIYGQPQITYSNIGGTGLYPGTGNINADPLFVSMWFNMLNFSLLWTSPCINAGDPDSLDPDGTRADMGAYYYDQDIPVRILLTPHNAPNVIPTNGGSINFTLQVNNRDLIAHQTTAWCDITVPDNSSFGPVIGPITLNLSGGTTLSRLRTQNVPASAPWGIYHFNAYAVVGADTSRDDFTFVKLGAGDGVLGIGDWMNTGEEFDLGGTRSVASDLPTGFSVSVHPNPFNPSTVISFELRAASLVTLEVFDINGRGVSGTGTTPTMYPAGFHQIPFDGSDLPSGIYFAKLTTVTSSGSETTPTTAVQKLVLLK